MFASGSSDRHWDDGLRFCVFVGHACSSCTLHKSTLRADADKPCANLRPKKRQDATPSARCNESWLPAHVISASLVSSDSTRHQCGSKSAPNGQTLFL